MVGFIPEKPTIQEVEEDSSKLKNSVNPNSPIEPFDSKIEDFSFHDLFLDFDSVNWFDRNSPTLRIGLEDMESVAVNSVAGVEMIPEESIQDDCAANEPIPVKNEKFDDGSDLGEVKLESSHDVSDKIVSEEIQEVEEELKTKKGLTSCIEEEMGKVSLVVEGDGVAESEKKSDEDETESGSESESESSSSSSSDSSTCSDNESKEEEEEEERLKGMKVAKEAGDGLEEGEIRGVDGETDGKTSEEDEDDDEDGEYDERHGGDADAMIEWSDDEDGDVDLGHPVSSPIRTKNELKEAPPVPQVTVSLQPHHNMLPVGVVLSVLGTQVIVEGAEKHNPLDDGSILWITEKRSPLGMVDEIFGPVKNPYYVVRYNSESEIPSGIHQGTSISFVQEFAGHVLNNKDVYKKGYDASGEHDEEVLEEAEFSDDEKEAEYRRMRNMAKRGMNEQKKTKKKRTKNRDGGQQQNIHLPKQKNNRAGQPPQTTNQNQRALLPNASLSNPGISQLAPAMGQTAVGPSGLVPQFQQMPQSGGFVSSGMPNSTGFSVGVAPNGMPWPSQNSQQLPHLLPMPNQMLMQNQMNVQSPMPMPNQMPMHNQHQIFGHGQMLLSHLVAPSGGQPTFFGAPSAAPWPAFLSQNFFNQAVFGTQGQPSSNSPTNADQGALHHGGHVEQSHNLRVPATNPGNFQALAQSSLGASSVTNPSNSQAPAKFSAGASFDRGKRPYHRGGGRFGRGRGRP